jgi:hypothetical protein
MSLRWLLVVSDVFPLSLSSFVRRCPLVEEMTGHGDGDRLHEVDRRLLFGQGSA